MAADLEEQLSITRSTSSQRIAELESALALSKSKFIHQGINTTIDVSNTATSPLVDEPADSKSPVTVPAERVIKLLTQIMRKKSHDARAIATGREQELLSQLSALTGKLLDLESQNQALSKKVLIKKVYYRFRLIRNYHP